MRISFNKAPEFFPIPFGIKASSVITVSASLMDWTRTSWIQVGETLEQKIARFGGGEMGYSSPTGGWHVSSIFCICFIPNLGMMIQFD